MLADTTSEAAQMRRQHIFVVNGDPAFLNLLRELLQDERYNVTTTNYLPDTFDQIEALTPDLLMVDVVVGQQAGWDLLDRLHQDAETRHLPVIVFSTAPALLGRARALDTPGGTRRFLAKPFDIEEVLTLVAALIGPA